MRHAIAAAFPRRRGGGRGNRCIVAVQSSSPPLLPPRAFPLVFLPQLSGDGGVGDASSRRSFVAGGGVTDDDVDDGTNERKATGRSSRFPPRRGPRIAIVGGGAAGMSAALHLSPLVSAGLVTGPVDVYESSSRCVDGSVAGGGAVTGAVVKGGRQRYPGSGSTGRDVGVGLWSTAWWPFLRSLEEGTSRPTSASTTATSSWSDAVRREKDRPSYRALLRDLERCGSYVKDVGYRTPDGGWLVESALNANPYGIDDLTTTTDGRRRRERKTTTTTTKGDGDISDDIDEYDDRGPALLFARERDLLSCLRNAIEIERRRGTIEYHAGVSVDGIVDVNGDRGALLLRKSPSSIGEDEDDEDDDDGVTVAHSSRYDLIIAADGLYSPLRSRYAGHTSTHAGRSSSSSSTTTFSAMTNAVEYGWEHGRGQREATQVEDRGYVVFRGNAPGLKTTTTTTTTTRATTTSSDPDDGRGGGGSFQTWGEDRGMRFAAVPFHHRSVNSQCDGEGCGEANDGVDDVENRPRNLEEKDEVVWFATISQSVFDDDSLDATRRKELLLEAFGSWHDPVRTLIETTPADGIMYESAIAHQYCANPVFDVARILEFESWRERTVRSKDKDGGGSYNDSGKIDGNGPILVFIGDAMMSVDPVLAQGITIAMESGASVVRSIERILVHSKDEAAIAPSSNGAPLYWPNLLRDELVQRSIRRERRLLRLLRSTELVQRMAQPSGFGSILSTWIVRPVIKLCPDVVKMRVFDFVIRYSLGLTGGRETEKMM